MGRKPFLLLYPITCCILRGATSISPSWMTLLAGRVLTETFSPAFFAAIQASMADVVGHQGSRELAVAMAKVRGGMAHGITVALLFSCTSAFALLLRYYY